MPWVEKDDMLPKYYYAPWGGLEAYPRGVMTNYFWVKMGNINLI